MFVVFSFHLNHNTFFVIINITIIMKISFSYRYLIFFRMLLLSVHCLAGGDGHEVVDVLDRAAA